MKILLVTDYPPTFANAPASRLIHLGRQMAEAGNDVRIVGSHTADVPVVPGVDIIALRHTATGGLKQALFSFRKELREQIKWADGVFARGYWIGVWAMLFAACSGNRVRVYDFHGFVWREQALQGRRLRGMSTRLAELAGLQLATSIAAVSEGVLADLSPRMQRKSLVLQNGVELGDSYREADAEELRKRFKWLGGRPAVVTVANFVRWLNVDDLINAAVELGSSVDMILVGGGPGIDVARAKKKELGADNVRIMGELPHAQVMALLNIYSKAGVVPYDAAWINSKKQNYYCTRKVKEYFASGLPVIVSDVPGKEAFLADEVNCLVYEPGSGVDLASKIMRIVEDDKAAANMAEGAVATAEKLQWSNLYGISGLQQVLGSGSNE